MSHGDILGALIPTDEVSAKPLRRNGSCASPRKAVENQIALAGTRLDDPFYHVNGFWSGVPQRAHFAVELVLVTGAAVMPDLTA